MAPATGHILLEQLVRVEGRKLGRVGTPEGMDVERIISSAPLASGTAGSASGEASTIVGREPWDSSCPTCVTRGHPAAHMNLVLHF